MATYKVSGTSNEVGVSAANLVIAYKADRASVATMGQEVGRVTASGGVWQILYDDWAEEVFVVCLDATDAIKYKAKMRDWVIGVLVGAGGSLPALPPNYDELYASVVVRIHADTDNISAGSGFDNIAANAWTGVGGAVPSVTQKKFGVSSMFFDGTDDAYKLDYAPDAARVLPIGSASAFTIEAWVYPTSTVGSRTIAAQYITGDAKNCGLQIKDGNLYAVHAQGTNPTLTGATTIPTNSWTHVALSYNGGTVVKGYVNGSLEFTGDWTGVNGFPDDFFTLGALHDVGSNYIQPFEGYIDEVRVTRAYRYPAAFSAPTLRFSNFGKSGANSVGSLPTNYVVNGNAETGTLAGWTNGVGTTLVASGVTGYRFFGNYAFTGHGTTGLTSTNYQWVALPAEVHTIRASFWQYVGTENDHSAILVEWFQANQITEVGTELYVTIATGLATTGDKRYLTGTASKPATAVWAKVWMQFNRVGGNTNVSAGLDEYVIQFNPEPEHYWAYPEPYAANVVSRLNFLEPDGSAYTVDRATVPLTWVFVGTGTVQAYSSPFSDVIGSYRPAVDGSYIYTDGLAGIFNPIAAEVCVRFWVKVNNIASGLVEPFFFMGTTTSDSNRLFVGITSTGLIQMYANLSSTAQIDRTVTASSYMTSGQWHHITVQKYYYAIALFIDGKYVTGGPINAALTLGTRFCLGMMRSGAVIHSLNGNIADVQILTNVAPHVTEFAPPPWILPIP